MISRRYAKALLTIALKRKEGLEVKEDMKAMAVEKPPWPVLKSGPHREVQGTWEFSVKNPNIAAIRYLKF